MSVINGFVLTAVLSIIAGLIACFVGRETGKRLALTEKGGLKENSGFFNPVHAIINILKLLPYILILFLLYLLLREKINVSLIIAISVFESFPTKVASYSVPSLKVTFILLAPLIT